MYSWARPASAASSAPGAPVTLHMRMPTPPRCGRARGGVGVLIRPAGRFREEEVDDIVRIPRRVAHPLRPGDDVVGRREQRRQPVHRGVPLARERDHERWQIDTHDSSEPPLSLRDAQQTVDRWIGQYKEGYFSPLTNVARLTEEVGELAREINHRFGAKTKRTDEAEGSVAMELADVLFVVICLANSQGIDLDEAFAALMQKVTSRDVDRWTRKER